MNIALSRINKRTSQPFAQLLPPWQLLTAPYKAIPRSFDKIKWTLVHPWQNHRLLLVDIFDFFLIFISLFALGWAIHIIGLQQNWNWIILLDAWVQGFDDLAFGAVVLAGVDSLLLVEGGFVLLLWVETGVYGVSFYQEGTWGW
jgi:hypothetical protein